MNEPAARPRLVTRTQREAGFDLLEILVVIAIVGVLIGLVAPAAPHQLTGIRVSVAKQSAERLGVVFRHCGAT